MELFAGVTDVLLSYDTDLDFRDGDLMLTNGIDWLKRQVYIILTTSQGDWKLYPEIGARPDEFIGNPNTRDTSRRLKEFIIDKIQPHVIPAAVSVEVVPLTRESVKCYLDLNIAGIEVTHIPFTMDYINGFVYPQIDNEVDIIESGKDVKFNDSDSLQNPNPYWDRLRNQ